MQKNKQYDTADVTTLKQSEVEITITISAETLEITKDRVLQTLAETLEIDGFRKGKAPKDIVRKHVGEALLLKETAERALQSAYPAILADKQIDAIGYPDIKITKLAWGNPLTATLRTAIVPDVTLPDYKKIAEKHVAPEKRNPPEVSDADIDHVLLELRKSKAHADWHQDNPKDTRHDNHPDFSKEENLPTLDDNFAAQMGPYKTVAELRERVRNNIVQEKELKEQEKRRIACFDEILDRTKIEVPEILTENELSKMIHGFKEDVARTGVTFEDYLKEIKKTEEDIRKEWRVGAEKRAKLQLVMNKIAEQEHMEPDRNVVEHEVKKLLDLYKDADPERARIYVETTLINEAVVKMLTAPSDKADSK